MSYKLPFTATELNEIKLKAYQTGDSMITSLFEHIENPERVATLEREIDDLKEVVADYRSQNEELESRIKKSLIV